MGNDRSSSIVENCAAAFIILRAVVGFACGSGSWMWCFDGCSSEGLAGDAGSMSIDSGVRGESDGDEDDEEDDEMGLGGDSSGTEGVGRRREWRLSAWV